MEEAPKKDVLKNIVHIMQTQGITQSALAKGIQMKQSGLSLILSGRRELKYETLLQIGNVLKTDVVDIINYGTRNKETEFVQIAAIAAMQGLLSNPRYGDTPEWVATEAYKYANALYNKQE